MNLTPLDWTIFVAYFAGVLGLALWMSRKPKDREQTSTDYFLAGKSLPWWIVGTSLIASNISAEQLIGMTGSAFASGIAIISYEWMAAVTLLIVAKYFLPIFLRMGIVSMPDYLAKRFDRRLSTSLGLFWLLVYVFVNLTSVLYLGALALQTIAGVPLGWAIVGLAVFSMIYTIYGGLSAVAWTDIVQVIVLALGGVIVTILGLNHLAGTEGTFADGWARVMAEEQKLHTVLPWNHPELPWIGVFFGGLWIANISYWGFNQYITQRALAGRDLKTAQRGLLLAAGIKVIMPVIVVVPGVIAAIAFKDQINRPDNAYPTLVGQLVPAGLTGLIIAGLVAAIVSSLNSMMNSAATIFTLDLYRGWIRPQASEGELVKAGRLSSGVCMIIAALLAPQLSNIGQAFQYIQEYTGMVSPGVVVIFLFGLFWKRADANTALAVALATIPLSVLMKLLPGWLPSESLTAQFLTPFLNRMGITFLLLVILGAAWATLAPRRATAKSVPSLEGEPVSFRTDFVFNLWALIILGLLGALYIRFW